MKEYSPLFTIGINSSHSNGINAVHVHSSNRGVGAAKVCRLGADMLVRLENNNFETKDALALVVAVYKSGCVAVMDANYSLASLWLKPASLPVLPVTRNGETKGEYK